MRCFLFFILNFSFSFAAFSQDSVSVKEKGTKVFYGNASFYANKFEGRKTASGEIFSQKKMTAASNKIPLGTWVRVTNLRNGRSVIVRVNDKMHPKMKRVADLSRAAATKLNFIQYGTTKVKVEVLGKKKPKGA